MEYQSAGWFEPKEDKCIPGQDGWRLEKCIYRNPNGKSTLWLAKHPDHPEGLVFKFYLEGGDDADKFMAKLHREVSLRAILDPLGCTCVVPIKLKNLDDPVRDEEVADQPYGSTDRIGGYAPFIALPYYEKGSLSQFLSSRQDESSERKVLSPVPIGSAEERLRLDLVAQVADHVVELHRYRVFHGDLRAPNVLVEWDERRKRFVVMLTDLGLSGHWCASTTSTAPSSAAEENQPGTARSSTSLLAREAAEARVLHEEVSSTETPPLNVEPRDKTFGDLKNLGVLLFQCVVNDFSANAQLTEDWYNRVPCPVIRKLTEDTQREGLLKSAEELAHRIRNVELDRRIRWDRKIGAGLVACMVLAAVMAWGWYNSEQNRNLLKTMNTKEIIHAGDVARANGNWEEARANYRRALAAGDSLEPHERQLLHERILRASIFLDDLESVKEELRWFTKRPLVPEIEAAVHLDRSVYLLELSMKASFGWGNPADFEYEKAAVALLKRVVDAKQVDPADKAVALGMLALTYEEAERRFLEALDRDPFHPFANLYLITSALLAGRLDLALHRAEIWAMMNRKDPAPLLYQALVHCLRGRPQVAETILIGISTDPSRQPYLPKNTMQAYRSVMTTVSNVHQRLSTLQINPWSIVADLAKQQLLSTLNGFGQSGTFRIPLTPAQRKDIDRLINAIKSGSLPGILDQKQFIKDLMAGKPRISRDPKKGLNELASVGSFVAPGLKLFFEAVYQYDLGDKKAATEALAKAAETWLVFDVRRLCFIAVAKYKLDLSKKAKPEEREQRYREARGFLRRAKEVAPLVPEMRTYLISLLRQCRGFDLAEELAAEIGDITSLKAIQEERVRSKSP